MNKLLSYLGMSTAGLLSLINTANAQTRTLDGIIHDQKGAPQKNVNVALNTPTGETTITDENGYYFLSTQDFPTGTNDLAANKEEIKVYPTRTTNRATAEVPTLEGTLEAYNINGQQLGKADLSFDHDLQFNGNGLILLKYMNAQGQTQTTKLLIQGSNHVNVHIQKTNEYNNQETRLKDAKIEDTFGYEITLTGENIKDTTIAITDYQKTETAHTQDATVNSKPALINKDYDGETFETDTLTIPLEDLIYTDDAIATSINFTEGDAAKIRNDTLLVYGNATLSLTADDDVNTPVTTQIMQFIKESYKKLTINASNEETNQTLNNARVIIDDLEGKLDTTYTENGQAQLNIKPGHLYVIKLEKTGYTGWVQELNSEKDTTIEKQLATQDTIIAQNNYKIPYMDAFDNGWRLSHKQTMKWDYNKERTLMIKTTDDDGNVLPQHYMDRLWEYIGKFEDEANNTPTLTQEQKDKIHNFFSRMNVEYVTEWPADLKQRKNVVGLGYSTSIPGDGSMGATKGSDWEAINALGLFHQSIVDDEFHMESTTKQELYSIAFLAVDPFGSSTKDGSILFEGTSRTTASSLDERMFKHEMNTPAGTAHKDEVEIAPISTQAATSTLVPAQYNR